MAEEEKMPDRSNLSFSQAQGLEPIPEPLKLGELSNKARSLLWSKLHWWIEHLHDGMGGLEDPLDTMLYDWYVEVWHRPSDEFPHIRSYIIDDFKPIFFEEVWNRVLDFVQFLIRHPLCPPDLIRDFAEALAKAQVAYTIVENPPTIVPRATEQEGEAIREAFKTLEATGFDGARTHLRRSAELLTAEKYSESIRESIHAVESVARKIDPEAGKTLGPALIALERHAYIHAALKEGFLKIYGYTSDEGGIRHASFREVANVDMQDAVFMIGACASFTTYLVGKARKAGLLNN